MMTKRPASYICFSTGRWMGLSLFPLPGLRKRSSRSFQIKNRVVLVDRYFPDLDSSYVTVDNFKGACGGVELLVQKGYRKIGLVTLDSMQVQMMERERGYTVTMEKNESKAGPEMILRISYELSYQETVKAIMAFLKKDRSIDAIFFTTNYLGVAGLEAIRNLKKKIPDETGIVCFDDSDLFRLGSPSISVVAQPIRAIGEKAVSITPANDQARYR